MLRIGFILGLLLLAHEGFSQTPRIDKVARRISFPFSVVEITGSGFSATATDLQVWFGSVKGNILPPTTESTILVRVPPQARLAQVEVINLASKRSARSAEKFMPVFSGQQPFQNSFSSTSFSNPDDIFDLCTCDFNGDGRPDIAGSKFKDGKSNLMVLVNQSTVQANNTTIAFQQITVSLNFPSFSVACGDLNGDGKPELVATRGGNVTGNTVFVFPNTSSLTTVSFGNFIQLPLKTGDFAKEVAIHDLNGDGRSEIVVTNGQTNLMYIFENLLSSATIDNAGFSLKEISLGTASTSSLALDVADLTADGFPEIIISPNTGANKVVILRNPGDRSLNFTSPTSVPIGGSNNINDLATADFNNDGQLDLVMADRGSNKVFVYLNRGNLLFQSVNGNTGFASPTAWGVDVADMNGDGFADIVTGNREFTAPQVNVYINNGATTPAFDITKIVTPKANWFVKAGDFDGDGKPDIAVTSTNNSTSFSIDIIKNKNCHKPVIINENPLTICNGQTIDLQAIPMLGVAFAWGTGETGPTKTVTFADAGTHTLTAVGEGGTCSVQTSIVVNQGAGTAPGKPVLTGPDAVCAGATITLSTTAVGGSPTYIWRGANDFQQQTNTNSVTITTSATAAQTGNYVVRIKVGDCLSEASDPKAVTVVEPTSFTISSSAGSSICSGQSVTLSVNPVAGYNYQWKKGGTNISGQTGPSLVISNAAAANAGSYTVLLSHQTIAGCGSETSPFALSVITAPTASFTVTPAQICVGTEVTFDGAGSTSDNTATAQYTWDFGDGNSGTGANAKHTYLASGSVTARLTVGYSGVTGCSNSTTKSVTINAATAPVITADPSVTEICGNGSESVNLTVTGTFTTYQWSTPSNNTGPSITVKAPGTYSVNTTDANGCTGKAELTLLPKPGCDPGSVPTIDIIAPKVFTPNNDQANDFWVIAGIENYPDCTLSVFDGKGRRVFEAKGSVLSGTPWNGMGTGGPVPDGTYYFVFGCPDSGRATGSVLIVR